MPANKGQKALIAQLAGTWEAGRDSALAVILDIVRSALNGNSERASAALLCIAEILRQGRQFPPDLIPFLIHALDKAAESSDACNKIAGSHPKASRPKNTSRDSQIFAHELHLRRTMPKKKDRMKILTEQYHIGSDAIDTVLKTAMRDPILREVSKRTDIVIAEMKGVKKSL